MLAQIKANHFTAGIELTSEKVTNVAPIVAYMIGWDRERVRSYCKLKGWEISIVKVTNP